MRGLAPGQKVAIEPPPSPTRHAGSGRAPRFYLGGTSIAARRNGARSPTHEAGLDPLAVADAAAAGRRFAVPEHDRLPGGARPVGARPAGGRRSGPAPP